MQIVRGNRVRAREALMCTRLYYVRLRIYAWALLNFAAMTYAIVLADLTDQQNI